MKAFLITILKTFGWKFLYAALGEIAAVLLLGIQHYVPQGQTDAAIWSAILLPALTGLVSVIKRLMTWDPTKAGQ